MLVECARTITLQAVANNAARNDAADVTDGAVIVVSALGRIALWKAAATAAAQVGDIVSLPTSESSHPHSLRTQIIDDQLQQLVNAIIKGKKTQRRERKKKNTTRNLDLCIGRHFLSSING